MSPRTAVVVALLAAFLFGSTAGLVGGFVLARWGGPGFGPPPMMPGMAEPRDGRPGPGRRMARPPRAVIALVERELGLTPEQSEQFRAALERQRMRMDAVHDSVRAEMERVLTPEQRERWSRLEERWRSRGMGRGMRGPGGRDRGAPGPPPDESGR